MRFLAVYNGGGCQHTMLAFKADTVGVAKHSKHRATARAAAVCAREPPQHSIQQQPQQLQLFQTGFPEQLQHGRPVKKQCQLSEQQHLPQTQLLEQQLQLQMQPGLYFQQHPQRSGVPVPPFGPVFDAAAAALSVQLKRAMSWQQAVGFVVGYEPAVAQQRQQQQQQQQQHGEFEHALLQLNPQHLSCLLSALARLQPLAAAPAQAAGRRSSTSQQQQQQQFSQVVQLTFKQVLQQLPGLQPRELSNILWAASKLRPPPATPLLKTLLAAAAHPAVTARCNAQDVSMCLYAAAVLGLQVSEQQVGVLLGAAAAQLQLAAPQAVANTLWAVATLQNRPHEQWLSLVEERCCLILQQQQQQQQHSAGFSTKGLHQLLWSMAKLQWVPEQRFLDLFWAASASQLPHMTPHGSSGLLWAAASLEVQPPQDWMQRWFQHTQQQLAGGEFGDQDVANALWALVRLSGLAVRPGASWLGAALDATGRVLPAAGSQELAVTLWALAKLGVRPPQDWMGRWLEAMSQRMGSYCAPALASSAYTLAVLRFKPPRPWCEMLVAEMQRQMAAFGAQELANITWALAVLGLRPNAAWLRDFEMQALNESGSFNAQELSLVCWSLAKLGHRPPVGWVARLLSDGLELQGGLAGQPLVMLMTALVKWDMPELKEGGKLRILLPRYWAASHQLLPACSLYQLSVLWWARARLGCMPSTAWSKSFWRAVTPVLTAAVAASSSTGPAAGVTAAAADFSDSGLSSGAAAEPSPCAVSQADDATAAAAATVNPAVPDELGHLSHAAVQPGSAALSAATVVRLVWSTGRMNRRVPGVPAELLLQAAELTVPQCSFAGLTALGQGLMRMHRIVANPAAATSTPPAATAVQKQPAAVYCCPAQYGLEALGRRSALWDAWFARSTVLLLADADVAAQLQLATHGQNNPFAGLQQRQQQQQQGPWRPRQHSIHSVDLSLQLFVAGQLRLAPPDSWCQAVLAAVAVQLPSMSLEQLSWVMWAAVRLGLSQQLPNGWMCSVLSRVGALLGCDGGAGSLSGSSSSSSGCAGSGGGCAHRGDVLRFGKAMAQLLRVGAVADADWQLWLAAGRQWCSRQGVA